MLVDNTAGNEGIETITVIARGPSGRSAFIPGFNNTEHNTPVLVPCGVFANKK